jgi:hypothetical protein
MLRRHSIQASHQKGLFEIRTSTMHPVRSNNHGGRGYLKSFCWVETTLKKEMIFFSEEKGFEIIVDEMYFNYQLHQ